MELKKELIIELFQKFEEAGYIYKGLECWSARELQDAGVAQSWSQSKQSGESEGSGKHQAPDGTRLSRRNRVALLTRD